MSKHMSTFEGILKCLAGHYCDLEREAHKFANGTMDMSQPDLWKELEEAIEAFDHDVEKILEFRPPINGRVLSLPGKIHNSHELR